MNDKDQFIRDMVTATIKEQQLLGFVEFENRQQTQHVVADAYTRIQNYRRVFRGEPSVNVISNCINVAIKAWREKRGNKRSKTHGQT